MAWVKITWSDQRYHWMITGMSDRSKIVRVPDEVVELWRKSDELAAEVQRQLAEFNEQQKEA